MKLSRVFLSLLAVLLMLSVPVISVQADEQADADAYARQLVNYYVHHGDAAKTDMACLIYALSEVDHGKAQAWASIMEYWDYVNEEMVTYANVLPDGLPTDDSLCIVVLGYQLSKDGTMKLELTGRLNVALASAQKYPNAYILCTGGGTAQDEPGTTEADSMAKWLIAKGISADRIIIENQSLSTVQNAQYCQRILSRDYPHITHLALVSSDYHLPRACLLFHAQANLATYCEGDSPLVVAANAASATLRGEESKSKQLTDLQNLTGIYVEGMEAPELSKLDCILASGLAQCVSGQELDLKVMAYYDTGLYRDVSRYAKYSGFDLAGTGMQTVTISYTEGGITATTTAELEMLPPEAEPSTVSPTEAPTEVPTEAPTEAPTEPAVTEPETETSADNSWLTVPIVLIAVLFLAETVVILRLRKLRKLLKAAREADEEALPDDDSTMEYV